MRTTPLALFWLSGVNSFATTSIVNRPDGDAEVCVDAPPEIVAKVSAEKGYPGVTSCEQVYQNGMCVAEEALVLCCLSCERSTAGEEIEMRQISTPKLPVQPLPVEPPILVPTLPVSTPPYRCGETLFGLLDRSQDGSISLGDFMGAVNIKGGVDVQNADGCYRKSAFRQLDADGNGALADTELGGQHCQVQSREPGALVFVVPHTSGCVKTAVNTVGSAWNTVGSAVAPVVRPNKKGRGRNLEMSQLQRYDLELELGAVRWVQPVQRRLQWGTVDNVELQVKTEMMKCNTLSSSYSGWFCPTDFTIGPYGEPKKCVGENSNTCRWARNEMKKKTDIFDGHDDDFCPCPQVAMRNQRESSGCKIAMRHNENPGESCKSEQPIPIPLDYDLKDILSKALDCIQDLSIDGTLGTYKYSFTPSIKVESAAVSGKLQGSLVQEFKLSLHMTLKVEVTVEGMLDAGVKLDFSHSHRKLLWTVDTPFGVFGLTVGLGYGFELSASAAITKPSLSVEIPVNVEFCTKFTDIITYPEIESCQPGGGWGQTDVGTPKFDHPEAHVGFNAKVFASAQLIATFDDVLSVYAKAKAQLELRDFITSPPNRKRRGRNLEMSRLQSYDLELELGARAGLTDVNNGLEETGKVIAHGAEDLVEWFWGQLTGNAPQTSQDKEERDPGLTLCMWENAKKDFAQETKDKWDSKLADFVEFFEWKPKPITVPFHGPWS